MRSRSRAAQSLIWGVDSAVLQIIEGVLEDADNPDATGHDAQHEGSCNSDVGPGHVTLESTSRGGL